MVAHAAFGDAQLGGAAGGKLVHYIDKAKTGRALGGRTALLQLLAEAAAGKVGRLFRYKFDRLGRSAETHTIVSDLEEHGVQVVSATEGTNQLARGIQLVVAADFSRALADRTRDGLIKRFEQGSFTGGVAPYGFRVEGEDGRRWLAVDRVEAAVVRDVAHWYLCEQIGFKGIAKRMRERQISSRRGPGWSFTSVRSMLLNPILVGRVTFNLRRMHLNRGTGRRVHRAKDEAEHLERQDESLRILDDETFARIQERIGQGARGERPQATRGIGPFTSMLYCSCGAKLYRTKSENRKGTYVYCSCSRAQRYDDCPAPARVREDKLVEVVNGRVAKVFAREDEIIARALELAAEAAKGNRAEGGGSSKSSPRWRRTKPAWSSC